MTSGWTVATITTLLCVILGLWWLIWGRHRYVGLGWVLDFIDGKVYVASRLLDSPAHRAGAELGHQLVAVNGFEVWYRTQTATEKACDIRAIESQLQFRRGQAVRVRLRDKTGEEWERTVVAEVIQGPIRVPEPLPRGTPAEEVYVKRGVAVDRRTGYLIETARPTDEALERVFR